MRRYKEKTMEKANEGTKDKNGKPEAEDRAADNGHF
jgi:hypothetical protein